LTNDYSKRIDKLENEKKQLLELCRQASERINEYKEEIKKDEQTNAYLRDIIMEFGDHFDWNDFMFQSTHLKMHLNTNHRIN
jgi:homoserine acetyltransferase